MSVLRWKPLKSSVQKARALTGALEAINIIISGLVGLLGVIALFSGSVIAALSCFILGVFSYFLFKIGYIALELLTEIADDTRLRLLELAGEGYDQIVESRKDNKSAQSELDEEEKRESFKGAIAGYKRDGGKKEPSFSNSTILKQKVFLRDINDNSIVNMVCIDGQWIREKRDIIY